MSFIMYSSKDTGSCHYFTESELVCFLMCTLLVTQTLACFVSGGKLAWVLICILLVTQTGVCLVSGGELA